MRFDRTGLKMFLSVMERGAAKNAPPGGPSLHRPLSARAGFRAVAAGTIVIELRAPAEEGLLLKYPGCIEGVARA